MAALILGSLFIINLGRSSSLRSEPSTENALFLFLLDLLGADPSAEQRCVASTLLFSFGGDGSKRANSVKLLILNS